MWKKKQQIQKKVLKIAKEQEKTLQEQTGVELHEWQQQQAEQENIQEYVAEVLAEYKNRLRSKNKNSTSIRKHGSAVVDLQIN